MLVLLCMIATTPLVVLEARASDLPPELSNVMDPLITELERYGAAARPSSILEALEGQLPRPGLLDEATASDLLQEVESGIAAFNTLEYETAELTLEVATVRIRRNPALALDPQVGFRALVFLAMAQAKLGLTAESIESMGKVVRWYDSLVTRAEYGPEVAQLYADVRRQLESLGRGALTVTVDARAQISVDGQPRGTGSVTVQLPVGAHTVFVTVAGLGRQYVMQVERDSETVLDVEWNIDSVFHADTWVGFVGTSSSKYATTLARRWKLGAIVLIGIGATQLHAVAAVYPSNGEPPRQAIVPLSEGKEGLLALAKFVFDGTVSGGVEILRDVSPPRAPARPAFLVPWVVGGAGVATLGAVGLVYVQALGGRPTPVLFSARLIAAECVVGGGALLGAMMYVMDRSLRPRALSAGLAVVVAVAAASHRNVPPHGPDSATLPGLTLGLAGMALGAWSERGVPLISGSTFGWAGTF